MKKVDLLIINNCPSFYKINLYNEIANRCDIFVVFLALTNQVVITDDYKKQIKFPFKVINEFQIEKRNRLLTFLKLIFLCTTIRFKRVLLGGYDNPETFLLPFFFNKKGNVLQCESNIIQSSIRGYKKYIKQILFSRYSIVLPSGKLHSDLFKALNFNGLLVETKGVGIINKEISRNMICHMNKNNAELSYIYIGRLINLKNVRSLIEEFNVNKRNLTIVGDGPLQAELRSLASDNISFTGFVANDKLRELYLKHDVFILPSLQEAWGVVVEEAIYWGLPVIVSDAVGSQIELVAEPQTGIIYKLSDNMALSKSITLMEKHFYFYKKNVVAYDFDKKDVTQVNAYLSLL